MNGLSAQVIWVAVGVLLVGAGATSSEALKCRGIGEALFAVDGEIKGILTDSSVTKLGRSEIAAIQIVCMDPRDSTFHNEGRGGPQVVSVWTVRGPVPHIEPTLEAILDAQDARARRGHRYATTLAQLAVDPLHEAIEVSVTVLETGWVATATVERYLYTCFVFDGDVAETGFRGTPRQLKCREES